VRAKSWAAGAAAIAISAHPAFAAGGAGPSEAVFLTQIIVLALLARVLGEVMHRIGQPSVMGALLGGLVLGPSVFGFVAPDLQKALFPDSAAQKALLDGLSQIGVLMLLLLAGMETDLALVARSKGAALWVSAMGVLLPFVCGVALGWWLPDSFLPHPEMRLVASLFLGTALSISSVKIVAMVVRDMGFMRRKLGQVIVSSAVIEDTIGWVIIAVTFGLASSASLDLWALARTVGLTAVFLIFSLTIGRRLVFFLIRWANDHFHTESPVLTVVVLIMAGFALTTGLIGVHNVLGAFVAGLLIGESPILTRRIEYQLRGLTTALFLPIFFGLSGLHADLRVLGDPTVAWATAGLVLVASVGKFSGAFAGGKLGGLTLRESLALGFGMNARGSTEVIVATIGLAAGVLSDTLFTMIVAMAMLTTLAMPPTLRWALSRVPLGEEEKKRLDAEEIEEKVFLSDVERILLAADGSASGRLAARVAGLLAGAGGRTVTTLRAAPDSAAPTEAIVAAGAQAARDAAPQETLGKPAAADMVVRRQAQANPEVVAREAEKGHEFLVIGVERAQGAPPEAYGRRIAELARAFNGPFALVTARGAHPPVEHDAALDVLTPVTGSLDALRSGEFGLLLARATGGAITALHVSKPERVGRLAMPSRDARANLKAIRRLADHFGARYAAAISVAEQMQDAIFVQATRGHHSLIVIAARLRAGDAPSFGAAADAVLAHAPCSVVLLCLRD
jgi:Kef-type K+ transport system membrane component KefB/nucleotide-binding universal stress UspA family protein